MYETTMDLLKLAGFGVIWILLVGSVWSFVAFLHWMKWSWALTWNMVFTLVAGSLLVGSAFEILDTSRHSGSGFVSYDDGEPVRVSESQYSRHKYVQNGFMLILGLVGWCIIAKVENNQKVAAEAKSAMYEAEANRLRALVSATGDNIDKHVWQCATDKAMKSDDYLLAASISERKSSDHWIASRIAKGEDC